ncbi:transketolase family protein, partial [Geobacillus zalihae]|uniref:transketolase family protein n=1 Tax=Geobacillus zalihae TaxID=213419 RepID=UPI0009F0FD28
QYLRVEDGNNIEEIAKALEEARADLSRPTLIEVKTTIGYGAPNKAGTSGVHGAPLGAQEAKLTKEAYRWTFAEDFYVPEEVYAHFRETVQEAGAKKEAEWNEQFAAYERAHPELAAELKRAIEGKLPDGWEAALVINAIAKAVPQLFGGSADLASSNKTLIKGGGNFLPDSYEGRNIWFGVREFAMGAALNGMALHGGLKVFGGTFFVFSDYLRPAIRLAALMGLPVIYVLTHDSIAVGEDGPTHEPIEHLASLRAMPNLSVIRPADANETAAAWRLALESTDKPTALVLTRQDVPTLAATAELAYEGVKKGAYVVSPAKNGAPEALLLATGSEVGLAVKAQEALAAEGIHVSVISMPSWDRFEAQPKSYRDEVLPPAVTKRLAIEMGASLGWERYVGAEGDILAIDRFGASAPGEKIMAEYGFTVDNVVRRTKALLGK